MSKIWNQSKERILDEDVEDCQILLGIAEEEIC